MNEESKEQEPEQDNSQSKLSDLLSWLQQIEAEEKKEPAVFGISLHISPKGYGSIARNKWHGTHDENTFIEFRSMEELSRLIKGTR